MTAVTFCLSVRVTLLTRPIYWHLTKISRACVTPRQLEHALRHTVTSSYAIVWPDTSVICVHSTSSHFSVVVILHHSRTDPLVYTVYGNARALSPCCSSHRTEIFTYPPLVCMVIGHAAIRLLRKLLRQTIRTARYPAFGVGLI